MDADIFKNNTDYWLVAETIKGIYLSESSLENLLDFERVLDELDLYAFRNWKLGELVSGPDITKYHISCIFMWPAKLMPDPRGALRLLPFDCKVSFKKTKIKIPVKITEPSDFRPGTHKAKLTEKPVWLVEIDIPKSLMNDIRQGSIDLEDENLDLDEIDASYDDDLDQAQTTSTQGDDAVSAGPMAPGSQPPMPSAI
jgi:hypothetical protein